MVACKPTARPEMHVRARWRRCRSRLPIAEAKLALAADGELAVAEDHPPDEQPNERERNTEYGGNEREWHGSSPDAVRAHSVRPVPALHAMSGYRPLGGCRLIFSCRLRCGFSNPRNPPIRSIRWPSSTWWTLPAASPGRAGAWPLRVGPSRRKPTTNWGSQKTDRNSVHAYSFWPPVLLGSCAVVVLQRDTTCDTSQLPNPMTPRRRTSR